MRVLRLAQFCRVWTPSPLTTSALLNMHTNTGRILSLNPCRVLRLANKMERKTQCDRFISALRVPRAARQASPEAFNVVASLSHSLYVISAKGGEAQAPSWRVLLAARACTVGSMSGCDRVAALKRHLSASAEPPASTHRPEGKLVST